MVGAGGLVVSPNQAPVASFNLVGAPAGSAVSFDASGARDPDGSVVRYDWDFGDGQALADGGPKVEHVYQQPGSYQVRLVVTDNEGASTRTVFTGAGVLVAGAEAAEVVQIVVVAGSRRLLRLPRSCPSRTWGSRSRSSPRAAACGCAPGATSFQRIETIEEVPVGSLVDTRRGKVVLRSVRDRRGGVQSAIFFDGAFLVRRRSERYITDIVLRGELAPVRGTAMRPGPRGRPGAGCGATAAAACTRGRYSSGAVRGTRWLTADSCSGTLTVVRRGRVAVRDFGLDRTVVVDAGERYLAAAP